MNYRKTIDQGCGNVCYGNIGTPAHPSIHDKRLPGTMLLCTLSRIIAGKYISMQHFELPYSVALYDGEHINTDVDCWKSPKFLLIVWNSTKHEHEDQRKSGKFFIHGLFHVKRKLCFMSIKNIVKLKLLWIFHEGWLENLWSKSFEKKRIKNLNSNIAGLLYQN